MAGRGAMRWTVRRKEEIIVAISDGEISTAEAKRQYDLSGEELPSWMRDYATHGRPGLRVTKLRENHPICPSRRREAETLISTATVDNPVQKPRTRRLSSNVSKRSVNLPKI